MGDDTEINPPPAPSGKQEPEPYGETGLRKQLASNVLVILIAGVLASLLRGIIASGMVTSLDTYGPGPLVIGLVVIWIGFLILHEFIHAGTSHALGYDFQINWEFPNPKVTSDGEFVRRRDSIILLLAPLVVINTIAFIGIISSTIPILQFAWTLVFILNAAGSASDIYGAAV